MASKEAEKKAEEVRQELQRFTEERIKQNKLSIPLNSNLEAIIATALDEFAAQILCNTIELGRLPPCKPPWRRRRRR